MNFLKVLFVTLMFSQISLASGPNDLLIESQGSGYGLEHSEVKALEVAKKWSLKRATAQTRETLDEYYSNGFDPAWEEGGRYCKPKVQSSTSSCKAVKGEHGGSTGMFKCDYEASYECVQYAYHESQ